MKKIQKPSKTTVKKTDTEEMTDTPPKKTGKSNIFKILAIVALIAVGAFAFLKITSTANMTKFKSKNIPELVKKVLGDPNTKFSIKSIKETSGLYEFELAIGEGGNAQKYVSYISKDGKLLFTSGIKASELLNPQPTPTPQKKLTCNDLQKADSPNLTAFVVSQCPFGLQMQRVFKNVLAELPQMASNIDVKYIGSVDNGKITSMHGDAEAQENLKQICIREEQKDKYWAYLGCYMQEGKTDDCLASAGVNADQLKSCTDDPKKGLKYAQADFDLANKYKIGGSPTLLLNGKQIVSEFDFGGRVPNAMKEIVCCGSNKKADFCSQEISKDEVASSFSATDAPAAGTTTNSAAGCGQ